MAYYAGAGYNPYAGAAYAPSAAFAQAFPASTGYTSGYSGFPAVSSYGGLVQTADYTAAAGLPFSSYSGAGFATSSYGLPATSYYGAGAYTTTAPQAYPELSSYAAAPFAYGSTSSYLPQTSVLGGLTASVPYGASGLSTTFAAPSTFALAPYSGTTVPFTGFSSFSGFPAGFPAGFGTFGAFPGAQVVAAQEPTLVPIIPGEVPPLGNETVTLADATVEQPAEPRSATPTEEVTETVEPGASGTF